MITIRKARTIIKKALAKGKEMELKPLSVIVLDAGGNILAFEREDGASPGRFQIALGKAYDAGEFLDVASYTHVVRWARQISARPAFKRGRRVNRDTDVEKGLIRERHAASDLD